MSQRVLHKVPIFLSKNMSFIITDIPVIIIFSDLIRNLNKNKTSFKISKNKYKITLFHVDEFYSCHCVIELFGIDGNITVEYLFRSGSRELSALLYNNIKTNKQEKLEWPNPSFELFCTMLDRMNDLFYYDVEIQIYEQIVINCKAEFLLKLNDIQLTKFKLFVTNLTQINDVELLRWGCMILQMVVKVEDKFKLDVIEWKSLLSMQYKILSDNSIFTEHLLKSLIAVLN